MEEFVKGSSKEFKTQAANEMKLYNQTDEHLVMLKDVKLQMVTGLKAIITYQLEDRMIKALKTFIILNGIGRKRQWAALHQAHLLYQDQYQKDCVL